MTAEEMQAELAKYGIETTIMKNERRTDQQRKAIEVFCRELGNALNDAGYETKAVMAVKQVDVPWTQSTVKDLLWRPIQVAMLQKSSTTELDTPEVSKVYEVLNRHIASNFGVSVPFPSVENG